MPSRASQRKNSYAEPDRGAGVGALDRRAVPLPGIDAGSDFSASRDLLEQHLNDRTGVENVLDPIILAVGSVLVVASRGRLLPGRAFVGAPPRRPRARRCHGGVGESQWPRGRQRPPASSAPQPSRQGRGGSPRPGRPGGQRPSLFWAARQEFAEAAAAARRQARPASADPVVVSQPRGLVDVSHRVADSIDRATQPLDDLLLGPAAGGGVGLDKVARIAQHRQSTRGFDDHAGGRATCASR